MKIRVKLTLLLTAILIFTATFGIITFASEQALPAADNREERVENTFEVYDPATGSASVKTGEANLRSAIGNISTSANNRIITLLDDFVLTRMIYTAGPVLGSGVYNEETPYDKNTAIPINVYIDLNGYDLLFNYDKNTSYSLFELGSNVNIHIYSSKPGGVISSVYNNGTKVGSYALFNMRYNGASAILGKSTPAAVLTGVDSSGRGIYDKSGTVVCDGDNLTAYCGMVFMTWSDRDEGYEYFQTNDITVEIDGGTYYRTHSSRDALLFIEFAGDLTARDATFISADGAGAIFTASSSALMRDSTAEFTNCRFIADTVVNEISSKARVTFKGCDFIADAFSARGGRMAEFEDCRFTSGAIPAISDKLIKTKEEKQLSYLLIDYNFNGLRVDTQDMYKLIPVSENIIFAAKNPSEGEEYARISWTDTDGVTVTEEWVKSDSIYPTPAISFEASSGLFRYKYFPELMPTSAGDREYTMRREPSLVIKTNLTLYTDFVYNIYIPKAPADSGFINHVSLDGGEPISPEELEEIAINGEAYYILKKEISAHLGGRSFNLSVNVNDEDGSVQDIVYTLSIPDYIDAVLAGNYGESQKGVVRAALTYIKAACNYYDTTGALPYPTEENTDLSSLPHIAGEPSPSASEAVKAVLDSVTLSLEGKVKFRFYLKSGISEDKMSMVLAYSLNGKRTITSFGAADAKMTGDGARYYEIEVKARDLREDIEIYLGTAEKAADHVYRLAYYAHFANDSQSILPKKEQLTLLVDALWNYSEAASDYIHGNGTPDVDIKIAGSTVTAATHIIIADGDTLGAAELLRDEIHKLTGETLSISDTEAQGKEKIVLNILDTPTSDFDFRIYVSGGELFIESGYRSFAEGGIAEFASRNFEDAMRDISFGEGYSEIYYTDRVYYSDFGARGLGKESGEADFEAIYRAHATENSLKRHTVCADRDAQYYIGDARIGGSVKTVTIKTNVDWQNAHFTIDDSHLSPLHAGDSEIYTKNIFNVSSDYDSYTVSGAERLSAINPEGKIDPETTVIDLGLGYPAMIMPYDEDHKVYRRKGYASGWKGGAMHEVIIIDELGNVDPETPIMFDYATLDKIVVYRIDLTPTVIEGGHFNTVAGHQNLAYYYDTDGTTRLPVTDENRDTVTSAGVADTYFSRGINIGRSNTTVKNVIHTVSGEFTLAEQARGNLGPAYYGFFAANNASYITFDGCGVQGRRTFRVNYNGFTGSSSGTYDITAGNVNGIVYRGCIQNNFWVTVDYEKGEIYPATEDTPGAILGMDYVSLSMGQRMHWGVGGTNYCKNIEYVDSVLSRMDAHAGVYNAKVVNTDISFISLTGNGEFIMENSRWFSTGSGVTNNSIIYLRNDYGSTWDGTVYMKDVKAYPEVTAAGVPETLYLLHHQYQNWYFGYKCYFPNVYVDNLELYNRVTGEPYDPGFKVQLTTATSSLFDPDMHLSETRDFAPFYADLDEDGDGLVDGTDIAYDSVISASGIRVNSSRLNLNPISPPKYIYIINNDGVNGEGGYEFIFPDPSYTSFFANTDTSIREDGFIIGRDDTPPVPWDPDK